MLVRLIPLNQNFNIILDNKNFILEHLYYKKNDLNESKYHTHKHTFNLFFCVLK